MILSLAAGEVNEEGLTRWIREIGRPGNPNRAGTKGFAAVALPSGLR